MDLVPTIDISDPQPAELAALDAACRDHGFFLLVGHGLDDLIASTFEVGARFFASDPTVKDAIRRDARNPLGYNDRELTKRRRDHKQVFDFTDPSDTRSDQHNRWPAGLDGFRDAMAAHYDAFSVLADRTISLILSALDLPDDLRHDHRGDRSTSMVRLNHYTVGDPVPEDERDGLADLADVALGQHTDSGAITLLLQDAVGGLQAHSDEHGWIDVEPRSGSVVVNIADCMQVWTNDRYRAALHRVTPMTSSTRMSIPYFSNPPRGAVIAPIEQLAGDAPRYRSFDFHEFISARGADNYADYGSDDIQITSYRV
jgi:isopenicillin N synthase-like dioxygenase